ncbi:hypothetical protein PT7_1455 [Pusillimonas sp. T7-7]|nr:hypothetical protein PT7_1455 [Pusillimonas sp. T7-7]
MIPCRMGTAYAGGASIKCVQFRDLGMTPTEPEAPARYA